MAAKVLGLSALHSSKARRMVLRSVLNSFPRAVRVIGREGLPGSGRRA